MNENEMKKRTKQFGLRVIRLVESFGANYRAACRGRSKADFISKAGISLEEADEYLYWMEMLQEAGIMPVEKMKDLMKEADELVAIFTASIKTAKAHLNQKSSI